MEEHTLTKIEIITRPSKLEELKGSPEQDRRHGHDCQPGLWLRPPKGLRRSLSRPAIQHQFAAGHQGKKPSSANVPVDQVVRSPTEKGLTKQARPGDGKVFSSYPYQTPSVFVPVTAGPEAIMDRKIKRLTKNRYDEA